MNIGFIGAGKVGCSMAKFFIAHNINVTGFNSRSHESAATAAEFTHSIVYDDKIRLTEDNDVIFITVPDGMIASVYDEIADHIRKGQLVCHCSGSLSSKIFHGIDKRQALGVSIHPLFAVSDRFGSYKELPQALFTIESYDEKGIQKAISILEKCDANYRIISPDNKISYHAAATVASNLMCGLIYTACDILKDIGFDYETSLCALAPLMRGNLEHIIEDGFFNALTGPLERADNDTVNSHLENLDNVKKDIYISLSKQILQIAKHKNPERDYGKLEELLK